MVRLSSGLISTAPSLDVLFFGGMSKAWEDFVGIENQRTADTARSRLAKRKEKLKQWHAENLERENILLRHEMANSAWMKSIYFTEHFKHQRLTQDQQDDLAFLTSTFAKMERDLRRPGAVFAEPLLVKWKLDRTEGRNRMRLRLLPDYSMQQQEYQPKRRDYRISDFKYISEAKYWSRPGRVQSRHEFNTCDIYYTPGRHCAGRPTG